MKSRDEILGYAESRVGDWLASDGGLTIAACDTLLFAGRVARDGTAGIDYAACSAAEQDIIDFADGGAE